MTSKAFWCAAMVTSASLDLMAGCNQLPVLPGTDAGPGQTQDAGLVLGSDAGADGGGGPGVDSGVTSGGFDGGHRVGLGGGDAGVSCLEASNNDLWAADQTPVGLPADQGRLLRCYHTFTEGLVSAQLEASPYVLAGLVAQNGYHEYVIQYVSESPPGTLRHVTALLYVPSTNAGNLPLVAVNHATNGIGPACGPTHVNFYADYMALPLVVQGFAVVATDYPGMGVADGVSPYAVGWAEAAAILDAVKAATQIHDAPRFDGSQLSRQVLMMGHSQGGQATLFAHGLFPTRLSADAGFDLLGSAVFAPAYGDLRGQEDFFADAGSPDVDNVFLMAMGLYADQSYYGGVQSSDWLTPAAASELPNVLATSCLRGAQSTIEGDFPTVTDLFQPSFVAALGTCGFDGGPCLGLSPFDADLAVNVPGDVSSAAPVLILQGEGDETVYPETTACIRDRLDARGTPEQTCAYAGLDHLTVVAGGIGDAVTWLEGLLDGGRTPVQCASLAETCLPDGPNSPR